MKSILSIFFVKAVITTAIVGAVALGVWYVHFAIEQILSTPHTFGDLTITPYGHRQNNLLEHFYDSIHVQQGQSSYMIRGPHLDITPFGDNRGILLEANEVSANFVADTATEAKEPKAAPAKKTEPIEFPDNIRVPFPAKVRLGKLDFTMGDMGWKAQNIEVQNIDEKVVTLNADSIQGNYIKDPAALQLEADFTNKSLIVNGKIKTQNDYVNLSASAPKNDLTQLKASTSISVKEPLKWVPMKLSKAIPQISNLNFNGNVSTSLTKKSLQYNFTLKTHIGEYWPFLPLDATIKVHGNPKQTNIETVLRNNEGGFINLDGVIDDKLDFDFSGEIANMSAMYGPQMMPMDMDIQSITKTGDNIDASIETREGSVVKAHVKTKDSLKVFFAANLSAIEPWALDWVKGNVEIGRNPKIIGSFQNNKLRAYVKIDSIINAYHFKADSLRLQLVLDLGRGFIDFPKVMLYTPNEEFSITGDVDYHEPTLRTNWNLKQKNGGSASTTVHVGDSLMIWAEANHAELSTIPFSDIEISDQFKGSVTGTIAYNLDSRVGEAELDIDGNVEPFIVHGHTKIRESGDTVIIDTAVFMHNSNTVAMEGAFVLPNDSNPNFKPTAMLPIQVLHAWASAEDFNLPILLEPLGDTTLASGSFNGEISFEEQSGLLGNIDFKNLKFNNIPPELLKIQQMNLSANKNKIELLTNFEILNGTWTGNANIVVDDVFEPTRKVSLTYISPNSGHIKSEGILNNDFEFLGTINLGGMWLIPETRAEIEKTDLKIDIQAALREGLKGINAKIWSDTTLLKYSTLPNDFPIRIRGELKDGMLEMNEISTQNEFGDLLIATLLYDLQQMRLEAIDISTEKYTLEMDSHIITLRNVTSHLEDAEDQMSIVTSIPSIQYKFNDETFGTANLIGKSDITLNIPHTQERQIKNKSISGNFIIDKLVYRKDLDIEITPSSLDKLLSMLNNAIANLRNKEKTEAKISVSSPIDLAFHVSDSQSDSVEIITPFASFPLTLDISILGTTNRPLLRGDVTNADNGFIGVKDIYEFDLNSFNISWNDVPWQHGIIDVSSTQELPYCTETEDKEKETCPVNLDIQGTITNPQPIPTSNCGTESTAADTYRNIFLGCVATESGVSADWNKLAGKAIGKFISSTANKTLGGDYIGDIDMKVMLFDNSGNDKDSSYVKVPISLDRWVKNLSLVFGYTQDQSQSPTYDQALQFGASYTLPVFQDKEYSHKNHFSPSLSLNGQIVRKQYQFNSGDDNDSRIEKNIGVNYTYKFWNPCILGIGHCETVRPPRAMLQPNDPNAVDSTSNTNTRIKTNETKPTEKAK
ncbi:hypothetical protein [Fibrobacter succinogenes]|uniref:hypothetical protein n=1 Tax=Fibrobacter succinogenes TaxID=833 RepID=UPI0026EEF5C6|nr:hypothetical protein [Fibrobacter succinogenes]